MTYIPPENWEEGDKARNESLQDAKTLDAYCRRVYPELYDEHGRTKRERSRLQESVRSGRQ